MTLFFAALSKVHHTNISCLISTKCSAFRALNFLFIIVSFAHQCELSNFMVINQRNKMKKMRQKFGNEVWH